MYNSKIRTFSEVDSYNAQKQWEEQIKKRIESESKEYILGVDEEEYKNFLTEDFKVVPLVVYEESEQIEQPRVTKEKTTAYPRDYVYEQDVYHFTIRYTFSGSTVLFKIRPSTWTMTSYEINVNEHNNTVSFSFKLYEQNPDKFKRQKSDAYRAAFTNLANVNKFADSWNACVKGVVNREFKKVKDKFLKENDFFAAINISTNKNTESIFSVPAIKKVDIPQPKVDKNKEFASIPTMSKTMYSDILKVVYDAGKSMEKKPALYQNKDEEGLRDQFLFILETRYEGITATGETFNKKGKTDIILKYAADNTNLFVAECKFWKGKSEFHQAINQLFDRYLTWRDSKVALIFFVKNNDFTRVLESVKEETKKHEYYKKTNGTNGESSFSYLFQLPKDENKNVYLEIILFHFDQ
ncbi:hypothetical protein H4O18_16430 [Arenibacter sp. BSSL-BM3]|uniref:Restriction endonuclease type IV Mrr domain-containing protein n=1 Tax=Arenibacter arenosicollis TaxID=2762274 RepID=A0ABR7QQY1_9FLAO|nr:hypothetical protein [Arenibacter arenosicollis]MBC8769586.1 hypothetical protein [Arenibacter arenosicollis]